MERKIKQKYEHNKMNLKSIVKNRTYLHTYVQQIIQFKYKYNINNRSIITFYYRCVINKIT